MSNSEQLDPRDEQAQRRAKVDALRDAGVDPYPLRFDRTATAGLLHDRYDSLADAEETDVDARVAGRVLLRRQLGKGLVFFTIRDASGTIQLFVSRSVIGDDAFGRVGDLDLGDWVGADGTVMKTKAGELSIKVSACVLLAKAIRPMPDKWHGLSDVDTRYRQRYVDLIANDDARRVFAIRFAAVAAMRAFLLDRGYVEVETPILQPIAGGATAKPFVTHHNALDVDLYLRIAPELYLKRLIVGGLEKVFELGRVFRNEGLSTRHNTEFTMLELYEAFVDYTDIMTLTEQLIGTAAIAALGTTKVEWEGKQFDLAPPWQRRPMLDLIREHAGLDLHPNQPIEELRKHCDALDIPYERIWGTGKLILEIYEKTTEANIVGPTFVCDYPREVSPFARPHRDDPALTERFELIVGGRELANAFSELNDPVDQLRRFEAQARLKESGDEEAQWVDHDYVRALEYGMPPCGGLGIGIDRVVMLLAGITSIREVILFPQLRPEVWGPDS
ncbi:MAG TPA: lysine--tRNA ligase [Acidimicrobiia bacterium]|nr:lysine--tRNA ligase [Acidimicrobiia bacterium]